MSEGQSNDASTTNSEAVQANVEESKTNPQENKPQIPHDPSRFEKYTVLEDQTGFKLEGSDHIYHFLEDGGWYDEHGNRYDSSGEPYVDEAEEETGGYEDEDEEDDFEEVKEDDDDAEDVLGEDEEDASKKEEEAYEENDIVDQDLAAIKAKMLEEYARLQEDQGADEEDYDEDYDEEEDAEYYNNEDTTELKQELAKADAQNVERFAKYKDEDYIRIDFENLDYKTTKGQFCRLLKEAGAKVHKVYFSKYHDDLASATFQGKKDAEPALKLNGQQFNGREVIVTVRNREVNNATTGLPQHKDQGKEKEKPKANLNDKKEALPTIKPDDSTKHGGFFD